MSSTPRDGSRASLLRPSGHEHGDRVAFVELFFDLVFVFALTQLGEVVAKVDSPLAALEATIVLAAIWWLWMHTAWVTNWLDPQRLPVRGLVLVLAAIGLIVSTSIQESSGERALAFALGYVVLQLFRTIAMIGAARRHDAELADDFRRIAAWFAASAVLWIGGALLGGGGGEAPGAQLGTGVLVVCWAAAITIDLVGPAVAYAVPGAGRAGFERWDLSAAHVAERASLFVIIALGESFLVTGFTFVAEESTPERVVTLASAFLAAAAMWWLYFDHGEWWGEQRLERGSRTGAISRAAYAYAHLPIIGGIVLVSVADKTVLAHPDEVSALATATVLGGPALFLLGNALFRRIVGAPGLAVALVASLACAALVPLAGIVAPWVLSCLSTGVLVAAGAVDTVLRLRRGQRSRG